MLIPNVLLHCPAKTSAAWFELPFKLPGVNSVSRFVARQEELQRLHKALEWTGERRTVVLHGLGGMGKTQTTNEFAKKHRDEYSAVIWLDARDTTTLKQGYRHLAKRIERETLCLPYVRNAITNGDHDEIVESAMRWLDEPKNNRWLVIYDNYDDVTIQNRDVSKAYDIRPFLPETEHGAILITTRSSSVRLGERVQLGKLADLKDSLEILASTSGRTDLGKDPDAALLAKKLDGLPLALATVGAYLDQVATSCTEYLDMYENSWLRLQHESPGLIEYDRALYSTWNVSLRHIQLKNQHAAELLHLWAYFDNQDLWYELLRAVESEELLWFHKKTDAKLDFDAAMRVLCEHGLAERNIHSQELGSESTGYSMHGCVHAWTIHVLETKTSRTLAGIAIRCVASHIPSREQSKYWIIQRRLLQHADRCVNLLGTSIGFDLKDSAWIYHCLGLLYSDQGRLKEAEAMYERALKGYEKALGPDHTSTLSTVNNRPGPAQRGQGDV
ncbi:hypothetical protein LY78DRAFT_709072 [Colletotrichum sublineola]|nr:hypothetical protein LY78DRAFT_709072 [Colletotrichum sublineola]